MGEAAKRIATYNDLYAVPDNMVGEIILGELHTQPRPRLSHALITSNLGGSLINPFRFGRGGGPGGWLIIDEPELCLGADVLVPDLAGWRIDRIPGWPDVEALNVTPDWVCEVLSPSTAKKDRGLKMPIYAREHIPYVWLIDPEPRTLEVYRLQGELYTLLGVHSDQDKKRIEPFDAIELELGNLWR